MTAVPNIDPEKYGQLLARTLPVAIKTEADNERMLAEIWTLMSKGESLSPEEEALLVLLSELVEKFEEQHYHIEHAPPHEILRMLIKDRGLRQRDLLDIFRSSGIASEVVNGKRSISKAQALRLAEFFHVSPELFLRTPTTLIRTSRAREKKSARPAPASKPKRAKK
jgi:HTH-type transcriptional regulator / antitoxin HigA